MTARKTRMGFKTSEYVVYPAHGVGKIVDIEHQEVVGTRLELFVILFERDKMTLRVPTSKVESVGMRKLSEPAMVKRAFKVLRGRPRIKRTMWSRRAQEYEAKINSGELIAVAEVVRDLYRNDRQTEQSYSERQLYEAALERIAREIAIALKLQESEAVEEIETELAKGPGRSVPAEDGGSVPAEDGGSVPAEDGGSVPAEDGGSVPTEGGDSDSASEAA